MNTTYTPSYRFYRLYIIGAVLALLAIWLCGCNTTPPANQDTPPAITDECDPFLPGDFVRPSRPNPNWRAVAGGLLLGDIKAKRLAAKRILKAPPGWDCPDKLDNSEYCTPLEDQGQTPWCAAYSMGQLLSASYWREFHVKHNFPEDQIYREAKRIDGNNNDGTTMESVLEAARRVNFGLDVVPVIESEQVFEAADVIFAVHKYGLVLVGMQISDGWNNLNPDGSIGPGAKSIGGHAVLVSGYSKSCNLIWGPNWWGRGWGKGGWWIMRIDQFDNQLGYGHAVKIRWEKKQ